MNAKLCSLHRRVPPDVVGVTGVDGITQELSALLIETVKRKDLDMANTPMLRNHVGDVLRHVRRAEKRTLRDVSSEARVSLGYLSEVERGQKEASSELLAAICRALQVPMSVILREVSNRIAIEEGVAQARPVRDKQLVDKVALLS